MKDTAMLATETTSQPLRVARTSAFAAVVLFDGECSFCQARVATLRRLDRRSRLDFLAIGDPLVRQRYPELSPAALAGEMHVIDTQGRVYRGAAAVRRLCLLLSRLWWLVPLMYIPGSLPLWQWLYRQVAARRYRLSKGTTSNNTTPGGESCSCHGACAAPLSNQESSDRDDRKQRTETADSRLEPTLRRREHAVG